MGLMSTLARMASAKGMPANGAPKVPNNDDGLHKMLPAFQTFLRGAIEKGGPTDDSHVVFANGTMVRLSKADVKAFDKDLSDDKLREKMRNLLPDDQALVRSAFHRLQSAASPKKDEGSAATASDDDDDSEREEEDAPASETDESSDVDEKDDDDDAGWLTVPAASYGATDPLWFVVNTKGDRYVMTWHADVPMPVDNDHAEFPLHMAQIIGKDRQRLDKLAPSVVAIVRPNADVVRL